jgi:hypothetical protein
VLADSRADSVFRCRVQVIAVFNGERIGDAVVEKGLAKITPTLKLVLTQILQGR